MADPEKIVTLLTDQNHKLKEEDREKVTYASAVAFLTHATPKDLEDLGGGIWQGTLKPGQLLWTPAGMIAGEQTSESDHLGLKVSLVAVGETGDSRGIATLRKMQMEGKDLNKKSDVLDEILLAVDAKQSDLKLKAAPPTEESQVGPGGGVSAFFRRFAFAGPELFSEIFLVHAIAPLSGVPPARWKEVRVISLCHCREIAGEAGAEQWVDLREGPTLVLVVQSIGTRCVTG